MEAPHCHCIKAHKLIPGVIPGITATFLPLSIVGLFKKKKKIMTLLMRTMLMKRIHTKSWKGILLQCVPMYMQFPLLPLFKYFVHWAVRTVQTQLQKPTFIINCKKWTAKLCQQLFCFTLSADWLYTNRSLLFYTVSQLYFISTDSWLYFTQTADFILHWQLTV